MIDEEIVAQGEDLDVELTVVRKEGGALDMSLAAEIYALIHDGYNAVVAKFKSGGAYTGWYLMDTTEGSTGKLKFKVLSAVTKDLKPGRYYIETRVRYYSGLAPDDNRYDIIHEREYFFTIRESQTTKLSLLP